VHSDADAGRQLSKDLGGAAKGHSERIVVGGGAASQLERVIADSASATMSVGTTTTPDGRLQTGSKSFDTN